MTTTSDENMPNISETKTETTLDVLLRLEAQFEDIAETLQQMRFYAIGTFVTITVIGALYAFFLVYALVVLPRSQ